MNALSAIIIGAGSRGTTYARVMSEMPDKFQVVGVADCARASRDHIQQMFHLPDEACFSSWEDILSRPRMADVAVIGTMDQMHYEPALRAIELGYHLLLEKPVAQTAQECADIALAAQKKGVSVLVCHVLRYTPFFGRVKQLLMDGIIGTPQSILHVEGVGNVHFSHSYVRGNWHCEADTTPMLLAKSCHDIDIVQWLLDKPCKKVSSFGDLTYFKAENAPEGAPIRCADGGCPVEDSCPYNCKKLYIQKEGNTYYDWFRGAATRGRSAAFKPTDEEVWDVLRTTDYGLCVFHANNDVVDHQVVNMEFEGGATVTFTMNPFNEGGRYIRIFGTKGELYARANDTKIKVYTFADSCLREIDVQATEESILGGHGGGDTGIVKELYEYLNGAYHGFRAADITTSVKNHLIGFAAEQARHTDTVVDLDTYLKQYGFENQ